MTYEMNCHVYFVNMKIFENLQRRFAPLTSKNFINVDYVIS